MTKGEIDVLRQTYSNRRRNAREFRAVDRAERGQRPSLRDRLAERLARLTIPTRVDWFGISILVAAAVAGIAYLVCGNLGFATIFGIGAELCCLAIDQRNKRPVSEFDDDED
jgi:hypothetical protein